MSPRGRVEAVPVWTAPACGRGPVLLDDRDEDELDRGGGARGDRSALRAGEVPSVRADEGTRTPDPLLTMQSTGRPPAAGQFRWPSGIGLHQHLARRLGDAARYGRIPTVSAPNRGFGAKAPTGVAGVRAPRRRAYLASSSNVSRWRATIFRTRRPVSLRRFTSCRRPSSVVASPRVGFACFVGTGFSFIWGHCDVAVVVLCWLTRPRSASDDPEAVSTTHPERGFPRLQWNSLRDVHRPECERSQIEGALRDTQEHRRACARLAHSTVGEQQPRTDIT